MKKKQLNKTIKEIFNDSYVIPLYQRSFAWGDDEILQLIQDIYDAYNTQKVKNYYIGSLVVLKRHDGRYEVIDGQQRLTVLTLLTRILEINSELKLSYDSRPEVEGFLREFYKKPDYTSCAPQTYNFNNAIRCLKNPKIVNSENKSFSFNILEEGFKSYIANNVILFRIEIPEDTDVASYFEIMNNRGEQLQKHEIFKARLMEKLDPKYHDEFNLIWTACSNMEDHIQACFDIEQRKKYFGENYDSFCFSGFANDENESNIVETNTQGDSIAEILSGISTCSVAKYGEKETTDKYNSIIDFPNFLMHVLKLYDESVSLDEKYLLDVHIEKINAIDFIKLLFKSRFLFDRYVIKTITTDTEDEFRWTLRKVKETDYNNKSSFREFVTFDNEEMQSTIIMAQSMLQVTFRQRIYKNWLYATLKFLHTEYKDDNIEAACLLKHLDKWINNYYKELGKFNEFNNLGTNTPHFVLNFIDYLYWRKAKSNQNQINQIEIKDFSFKYWNSVEHHLSVNKATEKNKGTKPDWIDQIGNLFLISKNANSRLSDRDVKEKVGSYKDSNMGPNRQIIYSITTKKNYNWEKENIEDHTNELKQLLEDCNSILNEM